MANKPYEGPKGVTGKFLGRTQILVSEKEVTAENVITVLQKALDIHEHNVYQIEYLYNYYKGNQPIWDREKQVRPEICNKIVVNRANEIVAFKVGYLCGSPIQYTAQGADDALSAKVEALNLMMASENKEVKDKELIEWDMICGTAYRMVLPDTPDDADDAIFNITTLDPRSTFVIYNSGVGHKPIACCTYWKDEEDKIIYDIRTKEWQFIVEDGSKLREPNPNPLKMIPIIEYPANSARLGAFEIVLPLLDAINNVESNRIDGIEQFIQSFIKFINCDIDREKFEEFKELGAILVHSHDGNRADVDIVSSSLSQADTQITVSDLYDTVLTICGMPNRNGGTSTSDTGSAVQLRDGWQNAEARAKDSEMMFRGSEIQMLKIVFHILRTDNLLDIKTSDIGMKFTRRNYENIQSKSQVLVSMLQNEKIHPRLAFEHCGMFPDPEAAYSISEKYYSEQMEKWQPVEVDDDNGLPQS